MAWGYPGLQTGIELASSVIWAEHRFRAISAPGPLGLQTFEKFECILLEINEVFPESTQTNMRAI
jgi:hypothetical protein